MAAETVNIILQAEKDAAAKIEAAKKEGRGDNRRGRGRGGIAEAREKAAKEAEYGKSAASDEIKAKVAKAEKNLDRAAAAVADAFLEY